ncbi:MAG TPA: SRPBCC domain-containing protein [Gemmatimonadaceae bacterium]|nr:SRPBCC domain-containing protein [Gemmatimonadaceae bacterium]
MIYKIFAGTVAVLAVLVVVALRLNTTGSYERTFNASPDKLWRVWNDPGFIKQWWGPKDYTAPIITNDPRVGGTFLWSMKSPKGEMFWNTGVYKEVLPNRRIVSTSSFSDATGRVIPGSQAPVPGHWPNAIIVTTEFTQSGGKTKVTVTEVGIPLIVSVLSKIAWHQQFDKIESLL